MNIFESHVSIQTLYIENTGHHLRCSQVHRCSGCLDYTPCSTLCHLLFKLPVLYKLICSCYEGYIKSVHIFVLCIH